MKLETVVPHRIIDLSGLRCPHTVIATIKALETVQPQQILQITATDLNAPSNMAAWCGQSGNPLLDMYAENEKFIFYIRKRGDEGEGAQ